MTEALRIAPEINDGSIRQASIPKSREIPFHLKKSNLRKIEYEEGTIPKLWNERGSFTEKRVQFIIASQTDAVAQVKINEKDSNEDRNGHDLTVTLNGNLPIETVYVQVKSSKWGITDYKRQIRDSLPEGERNMEHVEKWMTNYSIILINGSEEKSPQEILNDSFYPQLERIIVNELEKRSSR